MYNLSDLETYIAVVENRGINAAAQMLKVSPATVSLRLSKLEQALSTVLVFRDSRKLKLSPEGEIFYQQVGTILEALRDAEFQIGARRSSVSGVLRVTMPPWVFSKFVLPALMTFEQQYPDLKLEFLVNDRLLCASPDYLERFGTPENLTALRQHRWVVLPWQRQLKMREASKVVTFHTDARFTVSNSDNMTQAVLAGHGLGIKSFIAIREELESGKLVEVLPGVLADDDAPVWFLKPQNSLTTRKTEVFFAFMKSLFAQ